MPDTQKHIIQSAHIELTRSGAGSTNREQMLWQSQWQTQSSALVHEEIQPAIEKVFSSIVLPDKHLVIEKIELDLGTVSVGTLVPELEKRLAAAIKKAGARRQYHNTELQASGDGWSGNNGLDQIEVEVGDAEIHGVVISAKDRAGEAFIFFLKTGRLPFWWPTSEALSATEILEGNQQLRAAFVEVLQRSDHARLRLVLQVENETLDALAKAVFEQDSLLDGWHGLRVAFLSDQTEDGAKSSGQVDQLRIAYWLGWVSYLTGRHSKPNLKGIVQPVFSSKAEAETFIQQVVQALSAGSSTTSTESTTASTSIDSTKGPAILREMLDTPASLSSNQQTRLPDVKELTNDEDQDRTEGEKKLESDNPDSRFSEIKSEQLSTPATVENEAVFIQNAGLVLLHPFLPTLFREQKLWADGELFASQQAHARAVCLLGYLASGLTANDEHQLLLAKTLCNYPWEQPVASKEDLTRNEMAECDALLEAVINHWGALGSASPEGLRQGFVCRDGKLVQEENSWQLTIERKSLDILLDKLPWGYSLIKLPWMPKLMKVSWT